MSRNGGVFRCPSIAFSLSIACLVLSACGGGSGGSDSPDTGTPNRAPVFSGPDSFTLREGFADIGLIDVSDPDGDRLAYSIASGDDHELFTIVSSGQLSFLVPRISRNRWILMRTMNMSWKLRYQTVR